ncbi:hypothetical protein LWI29_015702 [Acer saccharum]|uniref:Uncharacterized protein n=1 Tax=Acer saccharum TaxID=4024 RepID=A0AA39SDS6_ACESA|nr:hypothetical protein LWI29_015702 [Acer saccharum]
MVALCFVLDLRSLSSPLLAELKQLANFYAISLPLHQSNKNPLSDRIGLCYLFKNRISSSDELKIAYRPRGNLSLRDFHHAVNNLPTDAFLPEVKDSRAIYCCGYLSHVKLSCVLSDQVLYSWGNKDIMRKVIVLSSCLPENIDSSTKNSLMDAAEKCVSVEFLLFEQKSSHLYDIQEHINTFLRCISDLDNCSFQTILPDVKVLQGLVKRWLQDLKDDIEEPLQVRFVFKSNLVGSVNQITCNLCSSVNQIDDGFSPCQTCRCHGFPLGNTIKDRVKQPSCPTTGLDLETVDIIENSVKVGENTVLFMPSFQSSLKSQKISSPVDFNVIERTPLGSLNEGVMIGASFVVTPSTCHVMETASDETDQPELNAQSIIGQYFKGFAVLYIHWTRVWYALHFVMWILRGRLPSTAIISCNHQTMDQCFSGSVPPKLPKTTPEQNSTQPNSSELTAKSNSSVDIVVLEDLTAEEENKTSACIAEEWEQLVVSEIPKIYSPTCISKPKPDQSVLSPPDTKRPLDEKTSKILERLEVPRQLKSKAVSPIIKSSSVSDSYLPMKKPLIPFQPSQAAESTTSSQLMKPNFQRLKRKHQ